MSATATANRVAGPVTWISVALIVLALFVLMRVLPVDAGIAWVTGEIERLGVWGPVVFGLVYIAGALLFIPGAAMTLAGGAIFGLWLGTATISVASTVAAALGFLISRYLARDKIAALAQRSARFQAIDEAIRLGDWRIIAMLRLSPALPYSLSNYLYGLTPVRFWPYVAASWIAMLPGTFMYVYVAHLSATGLSAAAQGESGRGAGQWALLILGLAATVAVTIYITKLAQKTLAAHTHIAEAEPDEPAPADPAVAAPQSWPWGATVAAVLALALTGTAATAYANPAALAGLFGPPKVELQETYAAAADGDTFDHSAFDALLHKHVDADGWVDYAGLQGESAALDAYIAALGAAPFDSLSRDAKLASLINAYNAFTLRLILDYYPLASIKDIPSAKRWDHERWQVAGRTVSLNQIEHELIRAQFAEPRIHFAVNCASVGCPPLRNEAFTAARLEEQLESQTRYIHTHDRWLQLDADTGIIHLTKLYDWYGSDFAQAADSPLAFAARYSEPLQAALASGRPPSIRWLPYDWSLNSSHKANQD